jgi:hypothetical protein
VRDALFIAAAKNTHVVSGAIRPAQATGFVSDGTDAAYEVDFQMSRDLKGFWKGFNDPESGIHHYQYLFSTTKATKVTSAFSAPVTNLFAEDLKKKDKGKYYLCVVAFNNALAVGSPLFLTSNRPIFPPIWVRQTAGCRLLLNCQITHVFLMMPCARLPTLD